MSESSQGQLHSIQRASFMVGGIGLVALAFLGLFNPGLFFRSYLLSYLFWLQISLGSLAILMLHHMVGGGWGFVIRRLLEAATRTLPLMALLFLPLLLGLRELFEWARPEAVEDEILRHKALYLNVPFFVVRAALYFAIWILLSYFLNKRSLQQDRIGDPGLTRKLQILSGPGLVLYGATVTFSSIDWAMSLEPHWFSTIYGMMFMVGQSLTALAFAIVALKVFSAHPPLDSVVTPKHFHDLGNLTLAFVMLWAYLSFSQYLITWSGNLPEEIPWYLHRIHGGWQYIGLFLILFHFTLPFLLLLSRVNKRSGRSLALLAGFILMLRFVDLFWLIVPALDWQEGLNFHWSDLFAILGIGGVWCALFTRRLGERALLPLHDPRFAEKHAPKEVLEHG
ncbi:MAG: hypothetical protein ACE5JX_01580 [Acidobacteriota bacterium]